MDSRSPKRIRLEAPVLSPASRTPIEGDDSDFYEEPGSSPIKGWSQNTPNQSLDDLKSSVLAASNTDRPRVPSPQAGMVLPWAGGIPGLGSALPNKPEYNEAAEARAPKVQTIVSEQTLGYERQAEGGSLQDAKSSSIRNGNDSVMEEMDGLAPDATQGTKSTGNSATESSALENENNDMNGQDLDVSKVVETQLQPEETGFQLLSKVENGQQTGKENEPDVGKSDTENKPKLDEDFLAAAAANAQDENAEWRIDSSDADSGSSDTTSGSSSSEESDDDSEDDGVFLDPEQQARILFQGEGDDEDGGKGGDGPLRTANEQVEQPVEKPDVIITPDMAITELGTVEQIVDSLVLIKAQTSGEFRVLESGSVLCLQDRTVIGAVSETLGRVQEPLYSVGFTNAKDMEDSRVTKGTKVFYADDHSTFVFTQAIKSMKGTDASNKDDEEPGKEGMEFSDDEKEAAYKQSLKHAKVAKRGGRENVENKNHESQARETFQSGPQRPYHPDSIPIEGHSVPIKYDDEEEDDDELYKPLRRPDNLHEMMVSREPLETSAIKHRKTHRGSRGGGRTSRQDRAKGAGRGQGRDHRQNGSARNSYGSNSSPNQNHQQYQSPGYSQPVSGQVQRPREYQSSTGSSTGFQSSSYPQQAFGIPQNTSQTANVTPSYQAGLAQPTAGLQYPMVQGGQIPAGAHINPAFLLLQQLAQASAVPHQVQQPQYGQPPQHGQQSQQSQQPQQPQQPQYGQQGNPIFNMQQFASLFQAQQQPQALQPQQPQPQPQQTVMAQWPNYAAQPYSNSAPTPPPRQSNVSKEDAEAQAAQDRLAAFVNSLRSGNPTGGSGV
jgi:H/ACA ribonucleoprotein complex non-core subunit NAF1